MELEQRNVKQVIVVRKDLKMRRGKEIAQASHASMAWLTQRLNQTHIGYPGQSHSRYSVVLSEAEDAWISGAFTKVCVRVNSEEELLAVHQRATEAGLNSILITDKGLTEFNGEPTPTCVGIGPDFSDRLDPITGDLTLY